MDYKDEWYEAQQRELAKLPCLKADEARKLANDETKRDDTLRVIGSKIRDAAEKGLTKLDLSLQLIKLESSRAKQVVDALRKLGYAAKHVDDWGGGYIEISW